MARPRCLDVSRLTRPRPAPPPAPRGEPLAVRREGQRGDLALGRVGVPGPGPLIALGLARPHVFRVPPTGKATPSPPEVAAPPGALFAPRRRCAHARSGPAES